jgi:hypothetical protein
VKHGILVIQTDARVGREHDFGRVYDGTHLPEVLDTPGFVAGRRFRAVTADGLPVRPEGEWWPNLAVYDIDSDDLAASYRALLARAAAGELSPTDIFSDVHPYRAQLFEQVFEARR